MFASHRQVCRQSFIFLRAVCVELATQHLSSRRRLPSSSTRQYVAALGKMPQLQQRGQGQGYRSRHHYTPIPSPRGDASISPASGDISIPMVHRYPWVLTRAGGGAQPAAVHLMLASIDIAACTWALGLLLSLSPRATCRNPSRSDDMDHSFRAEDAQNNCLDSGNALVVDTIAIRSHQLLNAA